MLHSFSSPAESVSAATDFPFSRSRIKQRTGSLPMYHISRYTSMLQACTFVLFSSCFIRLLFFGFHTVDSIHLSAALFQMIHCCPFDVQSAAVAFNKTVKAFHILCIRFQLNACIACKHLGIQVILQCFPVRFIFCVGS